MRISRKDTKGMLLAAVPPSPFVGESRPGLESCWELRLVDIMPTR